MLASLSSIAEDKVHRLESSLSPPKQVKRVFVDAQNEQPVLQTSCLCVQYLTSILLHNWRFVDFIWDRILAHFAHSLDADLRLYHSLCGKFAS